MGTPSKRKKKELNRVKEVCSWGYNPTAGWVEYDWINGQHVQVGKYPMYPKNSNMQQYFKRYSNKVVRRSDVSGKGNGYRRCFDYKWTIY